MKVGLLLLGLFFVGLTSGTEMSIDTDAWAFESDGHSFEQRQGVRALKLKDDVAWLLDSSFQDGSIEYDIWAPKDWSFQSVYFRAADSDNLEEFYIRPAQSGEDDSIQYSPRFNGVSGWQLYFGEGFWANHRFAFDRWMRVRLEVSGQRLLAFIDDTQVLDTKLLHTVRKGRIGFASAKEAAWFANINVTHRVPEAAPSTTEGTDLAGRIHHWQITAAPPEEELPHSLVPAARDWRAVTADEDGVVNIAMYQPLSEQVDTVLARVNIPRGGNPSRAVRFGYSDRVVVYYNGRRVYAGDNGWRSRDFRYLGSIGLFDTVFVDDTEQSNNELVFAVTESFGGWGVTAFLEPD